MMPQQKETRLPFQRALNSPFVRVTTGLLLLHAGQMLSRPFAPARALNHNTESSSQIDDKISITRQLDFSSLGRIADPDGCYEQYVDTDGSYHISVDCPSYLSLALVDMQATAFRFAMDIRKASGANTWYGAVAMEDDLQGKIAYHLFLLSSNNTLVYQKRQFIDSNRTTLVTEREHSLPESVIDKRSNTHLVIAKEDRGDIHVYYNGNHLVSSPWVEKPNTQLLHLGFAVMTNSQWQKQDGAHLTILGASMETKHERTSPYNPPDSIAQSDHPFTLR